MQWDKTISIYCTNVKAYADLKINLLYGSALAVLKFTFALRKTHALNATCVYIYAYRHVFKASNRQKPYLSQWILMLF